MSERLGIRVNYIDYSGSIVDGPGIRTVIYLQGCVHHCKGCHNPSTWDICAGKYYRVDELAKEVMQNTRTRKITISGGEPLLQMNEIIELISCLDGYDIVVYTGFNIEQVPIELTDMLNGLKVGPYVEELSTSTLPYVGSSNQQFLLKGVQI